MQTQLPDTLLNSAIGQQADRILRSCVHCGFCNATCPTYQLLGDELDGPRGRIYQIKQVLEGNPPSAKTQVHLDRCLTCRACETTCPSGVEYSRLLDTGRLLVEQQVRRPLWERCFRFALRRVLPYPARFNTLLRLAQWLRPLLPQPLRAKIPAQTTATGVASATHSRRMLLLEGCVQPALAPGINNATRNVFNRLAIQLISTPEAGCCGAISHHLSVPEEARQAARRNIDAWWPSIEAGAEAIVITASGCAPMIKDYAHLLQDDADYSSKAKKISALARDLSQILLQEDLANLQCASEKSIAFHAPCTLQHGQGLNGVVENILSNAGFKLVEHADGHLCCGSAGTYSLLQPALSQRLLQRKVTALESRKPDLIATANIGCLMHLSTGTDIPVRHWIELLAE